MAFSRMIWKSKPSNQLDVKIKTTIKDTTSGPKINARVRVTIKDSSSV